MTLPNTIVFPSLPDTTEDDRDPINLYLSNQQTSLVRMYEQLAENINGYIKGDDLADNRQWVPTLTGSVTDGTFTYTTQTGWVYRRGLFVDIWFDISWTDPGAATGNLILNLPYKVALTNDNPFTSDVLTSTFAYTAGDNLAINANTATLTANFWCYGSGVVTTNQLVPAAGTIRGHLRYMGVGNES